MNHLARMQYANKIKRKVKTVLVSLMKYFSPEKIKRTILRWLQDIIRDIESVETLIAQVNSLQLKLSDNDGDAQDKELTAFVVQLMRGKEVSVPSGPRGALGNRISKMFADAQKVTWYLSVGTAVVLKIFFVSIPLRNIHLKWCVILKCQSFHFIFTLF